MTREQRAWLSAVFVFLVLVLIADLVAWLRLGRQAAQLTEDRAGRGSAEGPTGDAAADLDELRRQLREDT